MNNEELKVLCDLAMELRQSRTECERLREAWKTEENNCRIVKEDHERLMNEGNELRAENADLHNKVVKLKLELDEARRRLVACTSSCLNTKGMAQ